MATSAATSEKTVRRWVSPAGTVPGSRCSIRKAYGRTTRSSEPSATAHSTRTNRERVARATSSPATGRLTKATKAA
ncbi:hypothetical protein AAH991_28640 [Microbispora sp. ZYX-F-249]|uniref:Uncharacterized protein n=1 Tax=Microbispora maris TaxID=3144104 RepID=A0ABV0AWB5_9ACTN